MQAILKHRIEGRGGLRLELKAHNGAHLCVGGGREGEGRRERSGRVRGVEWEGEGNGGKWEWEGRGRGEGIKCVMATK